MWELAKLAAVAVHGEGKEVVPAAEWDREDEALAASRQAKTKKPLYIEATLLLSVADVGSFRLVCFPLFGRLHLVNIARWNDDDIQRALSAVCPDTFHFRRICDDTASEIF